MRRKLTLTLATFCLTMTVYGQDNPQQADRGINDYRPSRSAGYIFRPQALPYQQLPSTTPGTLMYAEPETAPSVAAVQGMSEQAVLLRIGRVYRYQSEIMTAEAEGNDEQVERLLELAMTELNTLMQVPDIMSRPRFQELYRSVVTEYEAQYGSAPENMGLEYGEIFQFRQDMFIALNDVQQPLLEDVNIQVSPQDIRPVGTQVHMTMNRLVEQSMAYLLREPNKHLYRWMSRAETYFPMIEQILKEEGVPDEIKYLAMIESGLNPQAQSWAAAVGMWQFIAETGRRYDLQVTSYVDDRKDPEKATRAAARHLRDLYETFDDWQLALAAYNCGAGNVNKALRRLGRQKATFWEIYDYLPRETRGYVPSYIATALLVSNPSAFKLARVEPGPKYEYQAVAVKGSTSLTKIAALAGTDVTTLRALNPALRRNVTPPTKEPYFVRIPMGTYEQFLAAYRQAPQDQDRVVDEPEDIEYTVRRGDTLSKIAKKYGVTLAQVRSANEMRSSVVRVGQRLVIPRSGRSEVGGPLLLADASPKTIQYGERNVRPIAAADNNRLPSRAPQQDYRVPVSRASDTSTTERSTSSTTASRTTAKTTHDTRVIYKVKRGDSLTKVAAQYNVTAEQIKSWNRLRRSTLYTGQRLTILTNTNDQGDVEPSKEVATAAPARSTETRSTVHTVRRGDTLAEIAKKYGVTMRNLEQWNKLRTRTVFVGQKLKVQAPENVEDNRTELASNDESSREAESRGTATTHKVRRGETLGTISKKYGVTISNLREWNNIRGNNLLAGQTLKIYGGKSGASSASTTTTYRVKRGDSLAEIAQRYGVSVNDLKEWNNLRSSKIYSGQRLRIRS